jgi:uncharacterized repeat protein (TIGR04076 family)
VAEFKVQITIKDGVCQGGIHKAGDILIFKDTVPVGMCWSAWDAVSTSAITFLYGGRFGWENEDGTLVLHCPDPKGIILELKRIED